MQLPGYFNRNDPDHALGLIKLQLTAYRQIQFTMYNLLGQQLLKVTSPEDFYRIQTLTNGRYAYQLLLTDDSGKVWQHGGSIYVAE